MAKRIRAAFFVLLAVLALFGGAGAGLVSRTAAQEHGPVYSNG